MKAPESLLPCWLDHAIDTANEFIYDCWVGATSPDGISGDREFLVAAKLAIGFAAAAYCLATDEPALITAATSIPAVESLQDYAHAGSKCLSHHKIG